MVGRSVAHLDLLHRAASFGVNRDRKTERLVVREIPQAIEVRALVHRERRIVRVPEVVVFLVPQLRDVHRNHNVRAGTRIPRPRLGQCLPGHACGSASFRMGSAGPSRITTSRYSGPSGTTVMTFRMPGASSLRACAMAAHLALRAFAT